VAWTTRHHTSAAACQSCIIVGPSQAAHSSDRQVYRLEIGGVSPFGYTSDVAVLFDSELMSEPAVICGVGNPSRLLQLNSRDLVGVAHARVADIASR
jgi:prolyl-tRNA editing enzyme YbaK/EbsC (Cys-tRNA(Pro) deacylase)